MKRKVLSVLTVLSVLVWAGAAWAGWVLVEERAGDRLVSYIQDNLYRFDDPSGQSVLFDLNQGRLYLLNQASDCYWSGTPEEFEAQLKATYVKQMEEMLARLPESRRRELQPTLENGLPGGDDDISHSRLEVRPTDMRTEIAGYTAQKHEIWASGALRGEVWLAEKVGAAKEIDPVLMGRFMAAISSSGGDKSFTFSPEVTAAYEKGWPLRIVEYRPDGQVRVTHTRMVEEKSLPPELFKVKSNQVRMGLIEMFCPTEETEG